jgi:hypothetical protein
VARGAKAIGGCYKTDSARKRLIFNAFLGCSFFGHPRETLDFSRPNAAGGKSINKVIHSLIGFLLNFFEIKHLGGVSATHLKTIG